ncbi:MAG: hypothetical protein JW742_07605 [Candidatus Aminicenantes bacterium]|nr:hypothetical protein [Candidatus Aminicenantes bacterium]
MKAREVVLLLLIIAAGVVVHQVQEGNIPFVWDIDEGLLWNAQEFRFEETLTVAPPLPAALLVENLRGEVEVQGGAADAVTIVFTKRIYRRTEEEAGAVADRLRADLRREADRVVLSVKRDESKRRRAFETDLKILCPAATAVTVVNSYGKVVADGLAALSVTNPHGEVRAGRVAGPLAVVNSYEDVEVLDCGGDATVESRHAGLTVRGVRGRLKIRHHYGPLKLEDVTGEVAIDGAHASVTAVDCPAGVGIVDSYEPIRLVRVGPVRIETRHADVEAEEVQGTCWIRSSHARVRLDGVSGAVTIDGRNLALTGRRLEGAGNEITTSYETVDLAGFDGGAVVRLSHGELILAPSALSGPIEVSAEYARVRLAWPPGERNPLEARSRGGRVRWSLDAPSRTETNGAFILRAFEDAVGRPAVRLATTYEDIVIE